MALPGTAIRAAIGYATIITKKAEGSQRALRRKSSGEAPLLYRFRQDGICTRGFELPRDAGALARER